MGFFLNFSAPSYWFCHFSVAISSNSTEITTSSLSLLYWSIPSIPPVSAPGTYVSIIYNASYYQTKMKQPNDWLSSKCVLDFKINYQENWYIRVVSPISSLTLQDLIPYAEGVLKNKFQCQWDKSIKHNNVAIGITITSL